MSLVVISDDGLLMLNVPLTPPLSQSLMYPRPVSQLSLLTELWTALNWTSLHSPAFWRSYHRSQIIRTRTILPGGWIFIITLQAPVNCKILQRNSIHCLTSIAFQEFSSLFSLFYFDSVGVCEMKTFYCMQTSSHIESKARLMVWKQEVRRSKIQQCINCIKHAVSRAGNIVRSEYCSSLSLSLTAWIFDVYLNQTGAIMKSVNQDENVMIKYNFLILLKMTNQFEDKVSGLKVGKLSLFCNFSTSAWPNYQLLLSTNNTADFFINKVFIVYFTGKRNVLITTLYRHCSCLCRELYYSRNIVISGSMAWRMGYIVERKPDSRTKRPTMMSLWFSLDKNSQTESRVTFSRILSTWKIFSFICVFF